MSSSYPSPTVEPLSFRATARAFAGDDRQLHFTTVLSADDIQQAANDHDLHFGEGKTDVYSPAVTLWAWLSQCLCDAKSCTAAVARVIVLRLSLGLPPCSARDGGYCAARPKLSLPFLKHLTLSTGQNLEKQAPDSWRWHGRTVKLVDGTTLSAPDTPANCARFPKHTCHKEGLGFPMIRLVVLLGLASAALQAAALGPYQGKETGETALLRQLLEHVHNQDVLLADRYYCCYFLLALVLERKADFCVRLHHRRHADFSQGTRLGHQDHRVKWQRPARPDWMDEETYERIPLELEVREVAVRVSVPGFRTRNFVVVTSLLNNKDYKQEAIADLYRQRWHVELDIRNIKDTLGMDILSCQTPDMLEKEVWVYLLGYNLLRKLMAEAALERGVAPRQLSFARAQDMWSAFFWPLHLASGSQRGVLLRGLLVAIGTHLVGKRPNRVEPRERKRRAKGGYKNMTQDRQTLRNALRRALTLDDNE